jgi:hypothetical protein
VFVHLIRDDWDGNQDQQVENKPYRFENLSQDCSNAPLIGRRRWGVRMNRVRGGHRCVVLCGALPSLALSGSGSSAHALLLYFSREGYEGIVFGNMP